MHLITQLQVLIKPASIQSILRDLFSPTPITDNINKHVPRLKPPIDRFIEL